MTRSATVVKKEYPARKRGSVDADRFTRERGTLAIPTPLPSGLTIAARLLADLRTAPPWCQISRRERMLRWSRRGNGRTIAGPGICRGSGVLGAEMPVEIVVDHLRTRLRPMSDGDGRL